MYNTYTHSYTHPNISLQLTEDSLKHISYWLDYEAMLSFSKSSKHIYNFYQANITIILKEKLSNLTSTNISNFQLIDLIRIIKVKTLYKGNIFSISDNGAHGSSVLLINTYGNLFGKGNNCNNQLGTTEPFIKDIIPIPSIKNAFMVAAGYDFSLILTKNGDVYGIGNNENHQLGIFDETIVKTPRIIPGLTRIIQIAARKDHSLALRDDGIVYVFGCNQYGQLGIAIQNIIKIEILPGITNPIYVAAGFYSSAVVTDNGQVYVFGKSPLTWGSLDESSSIGPSLIEGVNDLIQIAVGYTHHLALNKYRQVYVWGNNTDGQLGLGHNSHQNKPVIIPGINNVIKVLAGHNFSLILNEQGELYEFGSRHPGFIVGNSVPTKITDNITYVEFGSRDIIAIKHYGEIYHEILY